MTATDWEQAAFDFDALPDARFTLHRSTDPDTSIAAAHTVDLKGDRRLVYETASRWQSRFPNGFTRAQLAELCILGHEDEEGRPLRARIESIRRRVSDFTDILIDTGERSDGEAIFKIAPADEKPDLEAAA